MVRDFWPDEGSQGFRWVSERGRAEGVADASRGAAPLERVEMAGEDARAMVVGYALEEKKVKSFLQDSLVNHARTKGVHMVPIDMSKPLEDQGPFDAILHKHAPPEWTQQLEHYESQHPHVVLVDPPASIARLRSRITMLDAVAHLQLPAHLGTCGVPKQLIVHTAEELRNSTDLAFPVIAKPLLADGSATSHAMYLLFAPSALPKLQPPFVLQEFVNHGGVIFKVYVAGKYVKCVRRKSLPDVREDQVSRADEPLPFSQISNLAAGAATDEHVALAELPDEEFVAQVADGLRRGLGLHLFNFDVIKDSGAPNHYHVIDINYFPGYAKMPDFESVFTDMLLDLRHEQAQV